MADNTTTVSVQGSDNGFSSMLDKIRAKAHETFEGLKQESADYADDVAGQIAWVEQQLKEQKKLGAQDSQAQKAEAIGRLNTQLAATDNPEKQKEIRGQYSETMRGIRQDDAEGKVISSELADIMTEVKEAFAEQQRQAQAAFEAEQAHQQEMERLAQENGQKEEHGDESEQQARDREARGQDHERDSEGEDRRQETEEDEEGEEKQARKKRSSWNPLSWLRADDVEDDYEEDDHEVPDPAHPHPAPPAPPVPPTPPNPNDPHPDKDRDHSGKVDQVANKTTEAAGQDVFHMVPALIAAIPFAVGLAGLASKAINFGSQLETSEGTSRGATGLAANAFDGAGDHDRYQLNMMGNTRAQAYDTSKAFARANGRAGGDLTGETLANMASMKAYDLDQGSMLALEKTRRYDKTNDRGAAQQVENLRGIMGVDNDNSRLVELMGLQNKLTQMQTGTLERVNSNQSAALLKGFEKLGGSFADDRAAERIQTVNQSLTNPNNEYKQALSYSVLRQMNPNADLFDMKKMQEKGVMEQGYLEGVMGQLQKMGGSESLKKYQLMEYTGLSAHQTEKLYDGYNQDPNFLKGVYSSETKRREYGLEGNVDKAIGNTGATTRESAVYTDMFAGAGKKFISTLDEMSTKMLGTANRFFDIGGELLKFKKDAQKYNETHGNKR